MNCFIFLLMFRTIGKIISGTMKVKMAGHPTIIQISTVPPTRPKGSIRPAKTKGSFVSIALKSLLRRFVILPSYEALAA